MKDRLNKQACEKTTESKKNISSIKQTFTYWMPVVIVSAATAVTYFRTAPNSANQEIDLVYSQYHPYYYPIRNAIQWTPTLLVGSVLIATFATTFILSIYPNEKLHRIKHHQTLQIVDQWVPGIIAGTTAILAFGSKVAFGDRARAIDHEAIKLIAIAEQALRVEIVRVKLNNHMADRSTDDGAMRAIERGAYHIEELVTSLVELLTALIYRMMIWKIFIKYIKVDDDNKLSIIAILYEGADMIEDALMYPIDGLARAMEIIADIPIISKILLGLGVANLTPVIIKPIFTVAKILENVEKKEKALKASFESEKERLKAYFESEKVSLGNEFKEEKEKLKASFESEKILLRNMFVEEKERLKAEWNKVEKNTEKGVEEVESIMGEIISGIASVFHHPKPSSVGTAATQKSATTNNKETTTDKAKGGTQASIKNNHCSTEEPLQNIITLFNSKVDKPKEISLIIPLDTKVNIKTAKKEFHNIKVEMQRHLEDQVVKIQYENNSNFTDRPSLILEEMGLVTTPFSITVDPLLGVEMKIPGIMMF